MGFVIAAYGIVVATIVGYTLYLRQRRRALSRPRAGE